MDSGEEKKKKKNSPVRRMGKVVENSPNIRMWPLVDRKRTSPHGLVMLDIKVQERELSQANGAEVTAWDATGHTDALR